MADMGEVGSGDEPMSPPPLSPDLAQMESNLTQETSQGTCSGHEDNADTENADTIESIAEIDNPVNLNPPPPEDEEVSGAQARIVNKLIKTIGRLRTQNAMLEIRISDSDKQNKLLQLQIDIMLKKMDILEGFMEQVRQMDDDGNKIIVPENDGLCRKCRKKIDDDREKSEAAEKAMEEDCLDWELESGCRDRENLQNPMLIDIVLANVLQFLPTSTLIKCREVNQLWCQEATYILKQRQLLTFNRDNIDKLPELMTLTKSSPSGNFLLRRIKFDIGFLVKSYRSELEEFFQTFGSDINYFSIHCDQENSSILYTEEVRNLLLPFLTNVQNLELSFPTKITEKQTMYDDIRPKKFHFCHLTKLKLRQMDGTLDIGGYSVPVVKELLKASPNMRCLHIESHTKEVVTRILQGLSDKECRSVMCQLEELRIDGFVTEEHLRYLLPLEFQLKILQLSYFTVDVTSAMLEALLCKHRTTLVSLIVGDYQKRTTQHSLPLIIKLPIMRVLKKLTFVDPLFPDHRHIMLNPLNYSEQLPVLEELSFEHDFGRPSGSHYFLDMFVCSPVPCETLSTLRISHGLGDPQQVMAAAKMFPSLKMLELANAPDPVIQMVWKEFSWIKVLYLQLNPTNLNLDSLMTGIPDQVCRRIQERNLFYQVDIMNALDIIRTEASISSLTSLETLRIDGFTSSLLTAVTGYLAFCHMPKLRNISIKADAITLSRECRRVLGEKLHLNLLEFF